MPAKKYSTAMQTGGSVYRPAALVIRARLDEAHETAATDQDAYTAIRQIAQDATQARRALAIVRASALSPVTDIAVRRQGHRFRGAAP